MENEETLQKEAAEDAQMMSTVMYQCDEKCVCYHQLSAAYETKPFVAPDGCKGCPNLHQ